MSLNAFFAYTVVQGFGYPWQVALMAVFIEELIFIVLSLTNVREAIFDSIPLALKHAVSVGIGLYIAFIGLKSAGVIVDNPSTLVGLVNFRAQFSTAGISALLALAGGGKLCYCRALYQTGERVYPAGYPAHLGHGYPVPADGHLCPRPPKAGTTPCCPPLR